jgi:hypothetical protein
MATNSCEICFFIAATKARYHRSPCVARCLYKQLRAGLPAPCLCDSASALPGLQVTRPTAYCSSKSTNNFKQLLRSSTISSCALRLACGPPLMALAIGCFAQMCTEPATMRCSAACSIKGYSNTLSPSFMYCCINCLSFHAASSCSAFANSKPQDLACRVVHAR